LAKALVKLDDGEEDDETEELAESRCMRAHIL
jgi:hypothetical protein